eukprot:gnl/Dysnectes_brevis/1664_a1894_962.p1 GENE.gnl/Dysnectes_brevis/1664_a1894_962~~gnl/Dysnectes_brevis/1664_a1894_962.p1  ORF type:complete len:378 (+),score=73.51 gnl/Dysnectes_brevis/1664_a1894_962:125-1258(+)
MAPQPLDPGFNPKNTLRIDWSCLKFNLAESKDIVQPTQGPPLCAVCKGIATSPMLATCCVQPICVKCHSTTHFCPLCKKDNCIQANLGMVEFFIKSFTMVCPYSEAGCDDTFALLDLVKHLEKCQHTIFICGCGTKMTRSSIRNHYRKECPLRIQSCPHCGRLFHDRDIQAHVDSEHRECEHCQANYAPADAKQHTPQPCPVGGCERAIPPCFLNEHLKVEHADHIIEENRRLQEENQLLKQQNDQLSAKDQLLQAQADEIAMLRSQLQSIPVSHQPRARGSGSVGSRGLHAGGRSRFSPSPSTSPCASKLSRSCSSFDMLSHRAREERARTDDVLRAHRERRRFQQHQFKTRERCERCGELVRIAEVDSHARQCMM